MKMRDKMSEEGLFKALSHKARRDIVRCLKENDGLTFMQLKDASRVSSTSMLSYYLKTLEPLIKQENDTYLLSESGKDAYNLIVGSSLFPKKDEGRFIKYVPMFIIGNAVLWAFAIFLVDDALKKGLSSLRTMTMLGGLSFASILLNSLLERHSDMGEILERMKGFFR